MWQSLKKRIIPGLSFGAIIGGAIYFSEWSYALILILSIILCTNEFYKIVKSIRDEENDVFIEFHKYFVIVLAICSFILSFMFLGGFLSSRVLSIIPLLFLAILFIELFSKSSKPFMNIGLNVTSLLYIGMPMFMANYIVFLNQKYDGRLLLGAMLLVMLNDVGAYFMGNWFGKTPLFSRISPKKTIEGTIGGYLVTLLGGYLAHILIGETQVGVTLIDWLVIAILCSTGAIIGDLVESLFKRSLQIKDSGSAIPGHGGFLDRFDAILYSLPIIAVYVILRF